MTVTRCVGSSTVEQSSSHSTDGGSPPTPTLQLSAKAHQRLIRERLALEPDPVLDEKRVVASSLRNAWVRETDHETAKSIILRYEWLQTMGTTDFQFGLYFGEHLAGAVCFGRTSGTKTAESICGKEYAHLAKTLNRGACAHWSHPNSASFLISHACRLMARKGFNIFVSYADPSAGEIGTVYQACGWNYCGTVSSGASSFVWAGKPVAHDPIWGTFKDGKLHDERNIQHSTRRGLRLECSRREKRLRMIEEGFMFLKSPPKHRYVGFYGDRRTQLLRSALRWRVLPYPKRERSPEDRVQVVDLDPVPTTFAAASAPSPLSIRYGHNDRRH